MANPVLIAKLALVAADPKTWQKIIIACISIFIISAALLGSCGAMTFTDLGFDCSQLFSAKLNEYSAVFDSGARINDKLLYAVYAKIFADNDRLKNQTDELIDCFVSDDKLSPLTDSDEILIKSSARLISKSTYTCARNCYGLQSKCPPVMPTVLR